MRIRARKRAGFCVRAAFFVAAFCLTLAWACDGFADTPATADRPHNGTWFPFDEGMTGDFGVFRLEAAAMRFTVPQLGVGGDDAPRRLVGIATPSNPTMFYGGRFGLDFRWGALFFEGLELTYMQTAQGQSDWERANGGVVRVDRDIVRKFDMAMGGGFQAISPTNRFKVSVKTDMGYSAMWSTTTMREADGTSSSGTWGDSHIYWRSEIAICQRVNVSLYEDARSWGCIAVAPNMYEEGWLNGVAVGLRADF
jgi:hypothetical protein